MPTDDWVRPAIDVDRPNAGRIYDFLLGGVHNFTVDRRVAEQVLTVFPDAALAVHASRAFVRRAVRRLAKAGVTQFLDLGSGIPTPGHVHEIAQEVVPDARVVYVDIDPLAVSHTAEVAEGNDHVVAVQDDVREPERVLATPEVADMLDLRRPVAVLAAALLHHIPDDQDPAGIIARLMAALPAGSHLAISHITTEGTPDAASLTEIYRRAGLTVRARSKQEILRLLGDLELVEPGLVWAPLWHPDEAYDSDRRPEDTGFYVGVARKG